MAILKYMVSTETTNEMWNFFAENLAECVFFKNRTLLNVLNSICSLYASVYLLIQPKNDQY